MPENEKTYLALVEEVDVDGEGQVVVAEAPVRTQIVYVDRYIGSEAGQPAEEEVVNEPAPVEEETAVAEVVETEESSEEEEEVAVDAFGNVIRYRKSFMARLIQTQNPNQDYYTELKNELLSYKGVKSRVSWNYDSFNKGRKKCAKIAIRGKTLILYLALDPLDEDMYPTTKYHQFNAGLTARFEEVPFGLKIRSPRALKYAKELIAILMAGLGLKQGDIIREDYHMPYETTPELIRRGLIKVIGAGGAAYEGDISEGVFGEIPAAKEEPAKPYEEIAAAEAAEAYVPEEEPVIPIADEVAKPKYVNKSFAQKMLLADEILQDRYDELKNYALRFKKIKARISKKFDSFNKGRLQFVKLSVAGKTLKLYLNMDINDTDPKFHCKDMRDKKTYEPVPVLLRIKSGRAVKYAKILIDRCAAGHGLVENKKFIGVDAIALVEEAAAPKK
ncbi:MAG: hypothetical protein J5762_01560 [Clostridia bacterium]|nr:hypothetical protein [Clostridia bacterium]